MVDWVAFSVDLEPNKDGSLDDVSEAMEWFNETIPRGTVYATHRIATELPEVIADLATNHEIAVHVHPREFGHENDQLAELDADRQQELITESRTVLAEAAGLNPRNIVSFRAGRHSASRTTLAVIADLGFKVDASININYTSYLPRSMTRQSGPFTLDSGLFELPVTFRRTPLFSKLSLRTFPDRSVTATANTLRTDRWGISGDNILKWLIGTSEGFSFYMHPYDATDHQTDISNSGETFRRRLETLIEADDGEFLTASDVRKNYLKRV